MFVCLQGNLSFSCVEPYTVPVFFNATSYLEVPGRLNQDLFSVSFQFRTWNPSGLLLFSHFADNLGNVEIDHAMVNTSNRLCIYPCMDLRRAAE